MVSRLKKADGHDVKPSQSCAPVFFSLSFSFSPLAVKINVTESVYRIIMRVIFQQPECSHDASEAPDGEN